MYYITYAGTAESETYIRKTLRNSISHEININYLELT